jgi:hypothetical protein
MNARSPKKLFEAITKVGKRTRDAKPGAMATNKRATQYVLVDSTPTHPKGTLWVIEEAGDGNVYYNRAVFDSAVEASRDMVRRFINEQG